jgi:hypothetical protein
MAPTRDENGDGRIDERDDRLSPESGPAPQDRIAESTTYRSGASTAPVGDAGRADIRTADRAAAEDVGTGGFAAHRAVDTDRTAVVDRAAGGRPTAVTDTRPHLEHEPEVVAPVGPRPRASLLATLALILGVAAALFVLTGALAGYGIGLGAVALLLSIGGLSATGRRHVAGKSDALIGLVLGLGAVVVGILAITGSLSWLTADADTVGRFREWLDAQFVDRF